VPDIVTIVEGNGEVEAFPILLRRLLWDKQCWNFNISQPPINTHGIGNVVIESGLERFLKLAMRRPGCDAILVLMDADIDCAKNLSVNLAKRALIHNAHIPTAIVTAKYRYENWFLASFETLRGKCGLQENIQAIDSPELVPDPKRWITNNMFPGRAYRETMDMAQMTQLLDINLVFQRSRSFKRLSHAVDELIQCIYSGTPKISPI
jgi:hypothetical protein